jgi:hypothetical protein
MKGGSLMRMSLKALGLVSALVLAPIAASPVQAEESHGSSGPMTGGTMNDESHGSFGSMMGGSMSNDSTDSMMKMMKMMMEMNMNMMNMMNMMEKMSTGRMNTEKGMMNDESHNASGSMMGGMMSNDSTDAMKMNTEKMHMGRMGKMMDACAKMMESRAD